MIKKKFNIALFFFFLLFSASSVFGSVGILDIKVDADNIVSDHNLEVNTLVVNRDDNVRAGLVLAYNVYRDIDKALVASGQSSISLGAYEVKEVLSSVSVGELISSGGYSIGIAVMSPSGSILASFSESFVVENSMSGGIFFENGPFFKIPLGNPDGGVFIESYGSLGHNIPRDTTFYLKFALKNSFNEDKSVNMKTDFIPTYSSESVFSLDENFGVIPANELKEFEFPLEYGIPGTYRVVVSISYEGKKRFEKEVRMVISGESASITNVFNKNDVYNTGDTFELSLDMIGPADGVNVVEDAYLRLIIMKEGKEIKIVEKEVNSLGFQPLSDSFSFVTDIDLSYYSCKIVLGKGNTIFDQVEIDYEPLVVERVITPDGRVYSPTINGCFNDDVCTKEELDFGNCYDCKNEANTNIDDEHGITETEEEQPLIKDPEAEPKNNLTVFTIIAIVGLAAVALIYIKKKRTLMTIILTFVLLILAFDLVYAGCAPVGPPPSNGPPPITVNPSSHFRTCEADDSVTAGSIEIECCPESGYSHYLQHGSPGTCESCINGDDSHLPGECCDPPDCDGWGTSAPPSEWYQCGKTDEDWYSMSVSTEWTCPACKELALRQEEEPILDLSSFNQISFRGYPLFSGTTIDLAFNAYIEACINRIPMMNLHATLLDYIPQEDATTGHFVESDNGRIVSSEYGVYARHETLDYTTENMGLLEDFEIPDQTEFMRKYTLKGKLRVYRPWAWRQRLVDAIERIVEKNELEVPGFPVDSTAQRIGDLYYSEDFLVGGKLSDGVTCEQSTLRVFPFSLNINNLGNAQIHTVSELEGFYNTNGMTPDLASDFKSLLPLGEGSVVKNIKIIPQYNEGVKNETYVSIDVEYDDIFDCSKAWSHGNLADLDPEVLAKCLYNFDGCLLNEINDEGTWYEAADCGMGPPEILMDTTLKDAARGRKNVSVNVVVYRTCIESEPWISEEMTHACFEGKIYTCKYEPSLDVHSFVKKKDVGEKLIIDQDKNLGFKCTTAGEWAYIN